MFELLKETAQPPIPENLIQMRDWEETGYLHYGFRIYKSLLNLKLYKLISG